MKIAILLITGLALSACSTGGVYYGSAAAPAQTASVRLDSFVRISLSAEQTAAVRAHFGAAEASRGHGRNGGLPPGIARNLERGKALPPGIAKQHLPDQLLLDLPRLDSGLEYVVAAGKLLLVEAATQIVRDVLIDRL